MYNKLFSKILDSSIWLEQTPTRIVWITLLAAMDDDGFAQFSCIANLANRAIVTVDEAEEAVKILEAPDLNSADSEFNGRRIERTNGGWYVLNSNKYRGIVTREESRRLNRERQARFKAKNRSSDNAQVTAGNDLITQSVSDTVSDTDTDTDITNRTVQTKKITWSETGGFDIPTEEMERYLREYKHLDVLQQLTKMHNWLLEHKKRRKKLYGRFITGWLNRQQS